MIDLLLVASSLPRFTTSSTTRIALAARLSASATFISASIERVRECTLTEARALREWKDELEQSLVVEKAQRAVERREDRRGLGSARCA
jgi:hypothetical protein